MSLKPEQSAPSWDEFRVEDDELDYEEDDPACEPNNANEYGPSLPPGFGIERDINPINDFAVSAGNLIFVI